MSEINRKAINLTDIRYIKENIDSVFEQTNNELNNTYYSKDGTVDNVKYAAKAKTANVAKKASYVPHATIADFTESATKGVTAETKDISDDSDNIATTEFCHLLAGTKELNGKITMTHGKDTTTYGNENVFLYLYKFQNKVFAKLFGTYTSVGNSNDGDGTITFTYKPSEFKGFLNNKGIDCDGLFQDIEMNSHWTTTTYGTGDVKKLSVISMTVANYRVVTNSSRSGYLIGEEILYTSYKENTEYSDDYEISFVVRYATYTRLLSNFLNQFDGTSSGTIVNTYDHPKQINGTVGLQCMDHTSYGTPIILSIEDYQYSFDDTNDESTIKLFVKSVRHSSDGTLLSSAFYFLFDYDLTL